MNEELAGRIPEPIRYSLAFLDNYHPRKTRFSVLTTRIYKTKTNAPKD